MRPLAFMPGGCYCSRDLRLSARRAAFRLRTAGTERTAAYQRKSSGVKGKAERMTDKDFQKQLQELVSELSVATDRLQGKKSHKARNRVVLMTGVTLGVLYNPWTGEATREWIMNRIAGENGNGLDDLGRDFASESAPAETGEPASGA